MNANVLLPLLVTILLTRDGEYNGPKGPHTNNSKPEVYPWTISVFWVIDLESRGVLNVTFCTLISWNAENVSTYSGDRWLSTANGQQIVVD